LQVVILFTVERYEARRDEIFKWLTLPYWQARRGVARAEKDLSNATQEMADGLPVLGPALPALSSVSSARARIDRHVAMLRTIEAIRLYAASHDGNLPDQLADISEVPVPIDPMTGRNFEYKRTEDRAVLQALPPASSPPETAASGAFHL